MRVAYQNGSHLESVAHLANHELVMPDRKRVGPETAPSAAVIDSRSVETTEAGGLRGYDADKKIKRRPRRLAIRPNPAQSTIRAFGVTRRIETLAPLHGESIIR